MGMPSMPELLVILLIVLLLFGAKKIPDLAGGIGRGIKNFKNAMKDDEEKNAQQTQAEADKKGIEAEKSATTTTTDKSKVS